MTARNRVGLGTFPLAGVFNLISRADAERIIKTFIEEDGYFIDTAPMYGYGYVEELVGQVTKGRLRSKLSLSTKGGYIGIESKQTQISSQPADIIRECENSLKRLQTDYIDIYMIHQPDPNTPFEETIIALEKLQAQGKIRDIAVSNVSLDQLKRYNSTGKIKYIQNRFSLINRSINPEFAKYLLDHKILLIPYQTVERGQLTSRVFEKIRIPDSDLRSTKPDWEWERIFTIAEWVKLKLFPISRKLHLPLSNLAINWCLHQNFLSHVVVGTTNQEHLLLNLDASRFILAKDQIAEIDRAFRELQKLTKEKFGKEVHEFRGLNQNYY